MNLDFSESQEMLRTSAKDFLSKECPKTKVRELEDSESGHDPEMWKKIAEMGWLGLTLPEEYDGSAMEFIDLVILMEEVGRNILPGPFFSTVCLCSEPILQYGTDEQKKEYLTKIADGDLICSLAINEDSASFNAIDVQLTAKAEGSDYVLNGTKLFVMDANVADCLLVVARTSDGAKPEEGVSVFLVDAKSAGVSIQVLSVTAFDKQCKIAFDNVKVPAGNLLGEKDKGWTVVETALTRAAILRSAEMMGACDAVTDMTKDYTKERVQYEHPLCDFQVVQHNVVDMWISTQTMKNITYFAAWKLATGAEDTAKEASVTKAWCSDSMKFVTERGVQMHGGIGITRDHDVGLYYRRAWAWDHMFGNAAYHREKVADTILS
jgi:alkylation response protein AidB-like acyl-CoA dehydrogenase